MSVVKISVIIPTYNSAELLIGCLNSLEKNVYKKSSYEVIVIDDGSTDNTRADVKNFRDRTKMKLHYFYKDNSGPARARNLGIKKAKGRIIAFTDADCRPDEFWLKVIHRSIINGELTLLAGRTYNHDLLIFPWIVAPIEQTGVTANLAVDKSNLKSNIFYFDDSLPGYGEDTDFVMRLENEGFILSYVANMMVYHPANILGARGVIRRANARYSEVLLHKRYGERVISSMHPLFRPIIFKHISALPLFLVVVGTTLVLLLTQGMVISLLILGAGCIFMFLHYFYRLLVTNTINKSTVGVTMRIITLFYLVIYILFFEGARVRGSLTFRYLLL